MRDDLDNVNKFFMPARLLRKRMPKAQLKRVRRVRLMRRFITFSLIVIAAVFVTVSFADIGSNMMLALANNYVCENMNLNLKVESVTGNPLKGYIMNNVYIEDENGKKILTAKSLSWYVSFSSLMKGSLRFRKIIAEAVSVDAEGIVDAIDNFEGHYEAHDVINFFSSPAFASEYETNNAYEIPTDRITITGGKINSRYTVMNIKTIDADMNTSEADIDGDINGVMLKGKVKFTGEDKMKGINISDMTLGSGKVTAIGGLFDNDIFDVHAVIDDLELKDLTAIFPQALSSKDFDGILDLNIDITGVKENPKVFGSIDYKGSKFYGFPIERMSANYNYDPEEKNFALNNIQTSFFDIPIQGEISAMNLFSKDVQLRVKLDGSETNLERLDEILNIPELKSIGGKIEAFNINISGSIESLSGLININAPKISYGSRTFSNIRLQMKLAQSSTANVEGKFTFEEANGFIQGNVESLLRDSNMDITIKIADIDIKRVESVIPDYPNYKLEGKITALMTVKGSALKPVIRGSLRSEEFDVRSYRVMKPVINFSISDRTLKIDETEGTINSKPFAIIGTLRPIPSSNPELDIKAVLNEKLNAGIRITGTLNNPSIKIEGTSRDAEPVSRETNQKEEISKDEDASK